MDEAKKVAAKAETKEEKRARKRAERAARKAAKKKEGGFWKDFKAFISRGNIIDLAIGLVIGAAFTAIVNSVVNDIIKPLISLLIGGSFSELVVELRPETVVDGIVTQEQILLNYGNLIMAILTFLIDAIVIFTAVRIVRKVGKRIREGGKALKEKMEKKDEQPAEAPAAEAAPAAAPAPAPAPVVAPAADNENVEKLLTEIRDLLRANSGKAEAPAEAPAADQKAEK